MTIILGAEEFRFPTGFVQNRVMIIWTNLAINLGVANDAANTTNFKRHFCVHRFLMQHVSCCYSLNDYVHQVLKKHQYRSLNLMLRCVPRLGGKILLHYRDYK